MLFISVQFSKISAVFLSKGLQPININIKDT